ncbi:MAG TPA: hypothetical protein VEL28_01930 [Candidatus Binatia bacterium]|nr:hypothetical protein [Candidatus Binatia bacterium]
MRTKVIVALCTALLVSGCSMRVSGKVTDSETGEPIGVCAVKIGPRTMRTDPLGNYAVNAEKSWDVIEFLAPDYEPMTAQVDSSQTRYPVIDVALRRKKAALPRGARFDPYTGRPLAAPPGEPRATVQ